MHFTILIKLLSFFNYREGYPRVLECILQTESPEVMLNHKDEILATLDKIANDQGKSSTNVCIKNDENLIMEKRRSGKFSFLLSVHVYGEKNEP